MKNILFLILCHFFINQVICHASDRLAAENGLNKTNESLMSLNVRKRITLADINEDCQWLIIKHLEMKDLLSLVEAEEKLAPVAGITFKRQLDGKTVVIGDSKFIKPRKWEKGWNRIGGDFIPSVYEVKLRNIHNYIEMSSFFDLEQMAKVLKYFGHFISKLTVIHDLKIPGILSRKLFGSINLYCSDTLTELYIMSQSDVFHKFKNPFKKLESISLNGWFDQFKNESITFASVFPAMTQLTLNNLYLEKIDLLNHNFPNLMHIQTSCEWTDDRSKFSEYRLYELIKFNAQIKKLTLSWITPDTLKEIAKIAPNLEHLELIGYRGWDSYHGVESITFERLKTFYVWDDDSFETFLVLPSLEEAEISERTLRNDMGFNIMNSATALKRLQINKKKNFDKTITFTNGLKLSEIRYTLNSRTNVFNVKDEQSEEVKKLLATIVPHIKSDTCKCTYIYTKE